MSKPIEKQYTLSTLARGCDRFYTIIHERETIAMFPVNNPAKDDAMKLALAFASFMTLVSDVRL